MEPTKRRLIAYFKGRLPLSEKDEVESWLGDEPDHDLVEKSIRLAMKSLPEATSDNVPESAVRAYADFKALLRSDPGTDVQDQPILKTGATVRSIRRNIFRFGAAAAAAAVACIMVIIGNGWLRHRLPDQKQAKNTIASLPEVYTAARASITRIQLQDGSTVQLFPGSVLTVSDSFNIHDRIVTLEGRAFFDVAHDAARPFFVHTNHISTRVLGTAFDISVGQRYTQIVVKEGLVQVAGHDSVLSCLHHDQGLSVSSTSNRWRVRQVDADEYCAWTKGELSFRQAPLGEILPVLELWYNVSFQTMHPDILHRKLTFFCRHQSTQQMLKVLSAAAGFSYSVRTDTIFIK